MPLVTCPDCGREISTAAPACPHCGRPAQLAAPAKPPPLPPPLVPQRRERKLTFFAKVPKTVWAMLGTGVFVFLLTPFVGQDQMDHMADDPLTNMMLNGLVAGAGGCIFAAYIAAIIFSWMKGKRVFATIGIILLFVPGMSLLPVIGAIRIARPNSTWARKYYGPEKMRVARTRFPKDAAGDTLSFRTGYRAGQSLTKLAKHGDTKRT